MKDLLIEAYRTAKRREYNEALAQARTRNDKQLIRSGEAAIAVQEALIASCEKLYLDAKACEFVRDIMRQAAHNEIKLPSEYFTDPSVKLTGPIWIELEKGMLPVTFPWTIDGFLFGRMNDPLVREALKKFFAEEELPEIADSWGLDVISRSYDGEAVFHLGWYQGRWLPAQSYWTYCTSNTCTQSQECKNCSIIRKFCAMLVCTILVVSSGYFADLKLQEQREKAERLTPRGSGKKERLEESEAEHDYRFISVNVREKKVYIPNGGEEKHTGTNWLTMHQPEEIEEIQKPQAAHKRHLRRGEEIIEIDVKESRPRNYKRLKERKVFKKLTT